LLDLLKEGDCKLEGRRQAAGCARAAAIARPLGWLPGGGAQGSRRSDANRAPQAQRSAVQLSARLGSARLNSAQPGAAAAASQGRGERHLPRPGDRAAS